jgi:hypothetical protein
MGRKRPGRELRRWDRARRRGGQVGSCAADVLAEREVSQEDDLRHGSGGHVSVDIESDVSQTATVGIKEAIERDADLLPAGLDVLKQRNSLLV